MTRRASCWLTGKDERGFTLVEVLVAIVIAAIVGGLTVGVVARSAEQERSTTSHVTTLNEGKTALERMTRDIRAADPMLAAGSDEIEVVVRDGSSIRWRRWQAYDGVLTVEEQQFGLGDAPEDWDDAQKESTTTQTLLRSLDEADLFTYRDAFGEELEPDADADVAEDVRAVRVDLVLESSEGTGVSLHDEVTVRNARGGD